MKIKTKRGARRIRNQRVVCKRFVVTDYTGRSYITAGKWYEVLTSSYSGNKTLFRIIDDDGDEVRTRMVGSAHLKGVGTWRHPII